MKRFLIGSAVSVAFAFTHGTMIRLRRKHSPRRSLASRELALRVRSDFWVSLDPAPTLLWTTERRTVGSVCDSRANIFLNCQCRLSYIGTSGVQNKDIPTSVESCLEHDIANASDVASGIDAHCAGAVVRSNKNPGIAAGVLHFLNNA